MNNFFKKYLPGIFFLTSIALTLIAYKDLPDLFYTNDEFLQYGMLQIKGISAGLWDRYSVWDMLLGRGRPLGTMINNWFFFYFPYSAWPFVIFSYILHPINSFLVYLIAQKISKNTFLSFAAGIFFTVSCVSYQAFTWLAATVQVVASTTFLLLSVYSFLVYQGNQKRIWAAMSFLCVYIAFLFKDSSLFILMFLPFIPFIIEKKYSIKIWIKTYGFLFVGIIGFGLYRLKLFLGNIPAQTGSFLSTALISRYILYAFNSIFFPFVSLGHFILPYRFLYKFSYAFGEFLYPFLSSPGYASVSAVIEENIIADMLASSVSIGFIAILFVIWARAKALRETIIFAAAFYIISMLPTAIYLDHRNTSYIESRYLYFSSLGVGILFSVILAWTKDMLCKKCPIVQKIFPAIVLLAGVVFLVKQVTIIQREVYDSVIKGRETKRIVTLIRKTFTTFPKNPIIYLDGNTSYYFYQHIKVPLQIGPGFIFLMRYYELGLASRELYLGAYPIWQLRIQEYIQVGQEGFGYFFDKEALVGEFQKNPGLDPGSIVGIYYDGNTNTFVDISAQIQKYVRENL